MLKINLRNEIYQSKKERMISYLKSLKASGDTPELVEYINHWFWRRKGKLKCDQPTPGTELSFKYARKFIRQLNDFTHFSFISIRRVTQIVRPNVKS